LLNRGKREVQVNPVWEREIKVSLRKLERTVFNTYTFRSDERAGVHLRKEEESIEDSEEPREGRAGEFYG